MFGLSLSLSARPSALRAPEFTSPLPYGTTVAQLEQATAEHDREAGTHFDCDGELHNAIICISPNGITFIVIFNEVDASGDYDAEPVTYRSARRHGWTA